jgi:hypothetical protein
MDNLEKLLETPYKAYVAVNEDRLEDGTIIPRMITWENGERYEIIKASKPCKAASTKAGGAGLRFTILVEGASETTFLWLEDDCKGGGRYFVERRRAKVA